VDDRSRLLDESLIRRFPEAGQWQRFQQAFDDPPGIDSWAEYPTLEKRGDQHLVVLLRRDGAVQVEWHVRGKRGSPFEVFMPADQDPIREIIAEAVEFVAQVVSENIVLAYHNSFFRGGRRFLTPAEVPGARRDRHFSWTVSWNGTHTWHR
jgi:hypothetical protein